MPRHLTTLVQRAGVADVSLIDRGAAVVWGGEGRYDRACHNHLGLTIDKDSKVEILPPMPLKSTPNRSPTTPERSPASKDGL
jgi:hypothetical protein